MHRKPISRTSRRVWATFAVLALGPTLTLGTSSARGALAGASLYTNELAGVLESNTQAKVVSTDADMTVQEPLINAMDGRVGTYNIGAATRNTPWGSNDPSLGPGAAYIQWSYTGTFSARTIISEQAGTFGGGFETSSPYQLSANSAGGSTLIDIAGQSSTGEPTASPYVITSSVTPIVASTLRATYSKLYKSGASGYATMGEIIAVADALTPVAITASAATTVLGGDDPGNPNYRDEYAWENSSHRGWAAASGDNVGAELTLTLAEPSDLQAIFIQGSPVADRSETFDIHFNGSSSPTVTDVSLGVGTPNTAFLKLDSIAIGVTSITLRFTAPASEGNVHWIGEVIPFEVLVPEPASATVMGVGAVALLLRRRRREG